MKYSRPENEYFTAHTLDQKLDAINTLIDRGSVNSLATAGDASLETAFGALDQAVPDYETACDLFAQATDCWQNAILAHCLDSNKLSANRHAERAARQIALSPHYNYLLMLGDLTPTDHPSLDQTYSDLMMISRTLVDEGLPDNEEFRKDITGNISELSVLALLWCFARQTQTSHEFMALPSLISQDRHNSPRGSYMRNRWDISVLTQYDRDADPNLAYKIQVKTTCHGQKKYAGDISVVHVRDDLSDKPRGQRIGTMTILRNLVAEYYDKDKRATTRLNNFTENLLDKIEI